MGPSFSARGTGPPSWYDPAANRYEIYNPDLAQTRRSPCSTFKILSSLIGLETGVIDPQDSTRAWSGKPSGTRIGTGTSASRTRSAPPASGYFREVIDEIGKETMQAALDRLSYGNCEHLGLGGPAEHQQQEPRPDRVLDRILAADLPRGAGAGSGADLWRGLRAFGGDAGGPAAGDAASGPGGGGARRLRQDRPGQGAGRRRRRLVHPALPTRMAAGSTSASTWARRRSRTCPAPGRRRSPSRSSPLPFDAKRPRKNGAVFSACKGHGRAVDGKTGTAAGAASAHTRARGIALRILSASL